MSLNGLYQSKHRRAYIRQVFLVISQKLRVIVHFVTESRNTMHGRLTHCLPENSEIQKVEFLMNSIETFGSML